MPYLKAKQWDYLFKKRQTVNSMIYITNNEFFDLHPKPWEVLNIKPVKQWDPLFTSQAVSVMIYMSNMSFIYKSNGEILDLYVNQWGSFHFHYQIVRSFIYKLKNSEVVDIYTPIIDMVYLHIKQQLGHSFTKETLISIMYKPISMTLYGQSKPCVFTMQTWSTILQTVGPFSSTMWLFILKEWGLYFQVKWSSPLFASQQVRLFIYSFILCQNVIHTGINPINYRVKTC